MPIGPRAVDSGDDMAGAVETPCHSAAQSLRASQLRRRCDSAQFPFTTTAELADSPLVLGPVAGDAVTLTGTVGSWLQREAAERGAGSAPGIRQVDNQIRVVPPEPHEFEPPDEIY